MSSVLTHSALQLWLGSHFTNSKYKEKCCIWIISNTMIFLKVYAKVMNSLLFILFFFPRVSGSSYHFNAIILLLNFRHTAVSSSLHWCSPSMPLPIRWLTYQRAHILSLSVFLPSCMTPFLLFCINLSPPMQMPLSINWPLLLFFTIWTLFFPLINLQPSVFSMLGRMLPSHPNHD